MDTPISICRFWQKPKIRPQIGTHPIPEGRSKIGAPLTDSSRTLQACGRPPLHLPRLRGRTLEGNKMTAYAVHFRRMQLVAAVRPLAQSHSASLPPPLPVSERGRNRRWGPCAWRARVHPASVFIFPSCFRKISSLRGFVWPKIRYVSSYYSSLKPRSRKELVTTKILLKAMAPAAMMGLSMPAAANGMPMML